MKRLTVKEIAKMAGVSVTAVSFVLNNKPGVSEATRQKVRQIIEETGFKPNLNSKKLVLNKNFNICLMINPNASPFEDLFYFEITRGILNRSRKYGYGITVETRNELPDAVYSGDTDGLIFMQDVPSALTDKALDAGIPFVVVDSHSSKENVTSINPDYCSAAYTAASYLIKCGHRDIAMIASNTVPDFYKQTHAGFSQALKENGIALSSPSSVVSAKDEDTAYEAAKKLLSDPVKRPTAILCTVDIFMIGSMRCAKDMGLSVPDDISLIGIDDILLSRYVDPPLTTIGIDKVAMGSLATDMLIQKIKGKKAESRLLPMKLIERKSVKILKKK